MARIAVVGSGIAGLRAAHRLDPHHDVSVFEAGSWVGGHTNTVRVDLDDETHHVDTGFIVHNRRNYPRFSRMLEELGVSTQRSDMSFAVSCEGSGIEYRGSPVGFVARPANLADRRFLTMVRDLPRFNRLARDLVADSDHDSESLREFLERHSLSADFVDLYLVPLGSAVWSADPATFDDFPARALARFLDNHGLLRLAGRAPWLTVQGGSRRYVEALTARLARPVRTSSPVQKVVRRADGVEVLTDVGSETFDEVVLALHADQALDVLGDTSRVEREVLGAFRYQSNQVTLHTDARMLPRRKWARASWNAYNPVRPRGLATVTYDMKRLQALSSRHEILVTLNRDGDIDPQRVLGRWTYDHPIYDRAALSAQQRVDEIDGVNRTWFCGAYWGYGFHEDGVRSADRVADRLLGVVAQR